MDDDDVLQLIAEADIYKLRDLYKNHLPKATYIYNYLSSVISWKKKQPNENYIKVMSPNGYWQDGTFIALHEFWCYDVFLSTLEKNCKMLYEALLNTKKIDWSRKIHFYAISAGFHPNILKVLEKTTLADYSSDICDIWWMPKEKALDLEINCPPEVYLGKLEPTHVPTINSQWPHRYENSEKYLATMIEMNGGLGVFLKSNGKLVAWIVRNLIGVGALQTDQEYKRKGYGSLVAKALAKVLGQDGFDPLGTVIRENEASRAMWKKIGFEILRTVMFTTSQGGKNS